MSEPEPAPATKWVLTYNDLKFLRSLKISPE